MTGRYTRSYNFSGFQSSAPASPLPATRLDAELIAIEQAIGEQADNLDAARLSPHSYASLAAMQADVTPDEGVIGWVFQDPDAGDNGTYTKSAPSGSPGWTFVSRFPTTSLVQSAETINTSLTDTVAAATAAEAALRDTVDEALGVINNNFVEDISALKALDTGVVVSSFLREEGKEGQFIFRAGDYTATQDEYSVIEADDTPIGSGAWVKKFYGAPPVQDFGGSDHAAFQRAINYAQRETGELSAIGNFELDDSLDIEDNLQIKGSPGKSVLDFSTRADWAKGSTDGLIRVLGSVGTYSLLTQNARASSNATPQVVAATRTGTSIEYEVNVPHGMAVGDPVWIFGTPSSSSQYVFYTLMGGVYTTRTTPYIVATVPTSRTFTVTCANTGDTVFSGSANVQYAADILLVASTAGFAEYDFVKIVSDAARDPDTQRIGEFGVVSRVLSSTMLLLHSALRDTYNTADNAKVAKASLISPGLDGLSFIGKGPNLDGLASNHYGDRGIYTYMTQQALVTRCRFQDVDQMHILLRDAINPVVRQNVMLGAGADEAGSSTGYLDIQYGVAVDSAVEGADISGNYAEGLRHPFDQTGTSTAGYYGVARDLSITNNVFKGAWLGAIATHQCTGRLVVTGNTLVDCEVGVNIRYCDDAIVSNNNIRAFASGIHLYRVVKGISMTGNVIRGSEFGFRLDAINDAASFTGPLTFTNNDVTATKPVYIYAPILDCNAEIYVDDNRLGGCDDYGVHVQVGTDSGGGFSGSVSRNSVVGVSDVYSRGYAYRLVNGKKLKVLDNSADGNSVAFSRIVRFEGAQTSGIVERGTLAIGTAASVALVDLAAGTATRLGSLEDRPLVVTGDTTCDHRNIYINDKSGSACVFTLPSAASFPGRSLKFINRHAQAINSASSNVVPIAGGSATTALVTNTAGKYAVVTSDGSNWLITEAN